MKKIHPEGIPLPGTKLYNRISKTNIFQKHYELLAADITSYCNSGKILDIGTGPGWLLITLHDRSPDLDLVGLDISGSMVSAARKNMEEHGTADKVKIVEGSAADLPFKNEEFDLVVSTGAVHHWKNLNDCLNSIHRVLKKDGFALLYDLVSDTPEEVLTEAKKQFGRLNMFLLWLHAFEEPFHTCNDFGQLHNGSLFCKGKTKFVGVMDCLILQK